MSRLLIVSNRLPIAAQRHKNEITVVPTAGGLATGLDPIRRCRETAWIGWPGTTSRWSEKAKKALEERLEPGGFKPVHIDPRLMHGFYNDFSNGILWPLYHYLPAQLPIEMTGWTEFKAVNALYADAVVAAYREGDVIWIHDYHLSLLPQLVRERLPTARIGFFLHIPFPSSEVFRILPCREELLRGMLGADLVGFHTSAYANNFASSALRIVGRETFVDRIIMDDGRTVAVGSFPLGVDVERFTAVGQPSELTEGLDGLAAARPGTKLLLAVDRLDYTKGIPRRLLAFERLLELFPEYRGRAVMVQVAVPSRSDVFAYETTKRTVDEYVGRINGRFGAPGHQPIHYVSRGFSQDELVQLYRRVDVMVVTPIRDGMNLVAKEFCASRTDDDGVLMLSEFAGAAAEMGEALIVNPYDLDQTAEAMRRGLEMPRAERHERMLALRARIVKNDCQKWSNEIVRRIEGRQKPAPQAMPEPTSPEALAARCATGSLALVLDYDGTLVPIAATPELATPDAELVSILEELVARDDTFVKIVSGRPREALDQFLPIAGLQFSAEHGVWDKPAFEDWRLAQGAQLPACDWKRPVLELLRRAVDDLPGSFIEEKTSCLVWHYRLADAVSADSRARELQYQLSDAFSASGLSVSSGKKVVEVRASRLTKGDAVESMKQALPHDAGVTLAIGDDLTDEDMFQRLGPRDLSVHVGEPTGSARYAVREVDDVRRLLRLLAARPVSAARTAGMLA